MTRELTVTCQIGRHETGRKLLDLLTERFPYHDRSRWQDIIQAGRVRLNGELPGHDQLVRQGDLLAYHVDDHQEPAVSQEIEVVLETPDLLLVGKPAGTPLHRTGQIIVHTFVNQLRRRFNQDIHPLHRLDRETSGLLLCARNREASRNSQDRRDELITGKYYLAVVKGAFPEQGVTVEQPLGTREDSPVRCRMWPEAAGKPCTTRFRKVAGNAARSLLLVELTTGRRHQIRAHLAGLRYPLVGDKIYDHDGRYYLKRLERPLTEEDFRQLGSRYHALHAWALQLRLPDRPQQLCFSRLFSADFAALLGQFPDWEERARACLQAVSGRGDAAPESVTAELRQNKPGGVL